MTVKDWAFDWCIKEKVASPGRVAMERHEPKKLISRGRNEEVTLVEYLSLRCNQEEQAFFIAVQMAHFVMARRASQH